MAAELPRIKVCGITCAEDLALAVRYGADALGFVHHDLSPRHLELARAAELAGGAPAHVAKVLVLVSADPESAAVWVEQMGASHVQLCGQERPGDWRAFGAGLLRRVAVEDGALGELEAWDGVADGFVLDHPSAPGGTGQVVDLELAARLCARAPCLLAGGLGPDNVAELVARVSPHGVDASSKLESAPGLKDPRQLEAFVHAARIALAGTERTA